MINIVYANRKNCLKEVGGDTIQMLKTKQHIENRYNAKIDIVDNYMEIEKKDAKLIHIFNIQNIHETLKYIDIAKKNKKLVVLSTIYWDLTNAYYIDFLSKWLRLYPDKEMYIKYKNIILEIICKIKSMYKIEDFIGSKSYIKLRREAILKADLLLPNSIEELEIISDEFKINYYDLKQKSEIIPNAADISLFRKGDVTNEERIYDVIQIGRIEPIKNQINVVKSLFDLKDISIVFVGRPNNKKYYNKLKEISLKRGNVYFINELNNKEVYELLKKSKVHVLPSYRESPGLASIEALFSGCKIVVSDERFCPIKFYEFDKYGFICSPYDVKSIRESILKALNSENKNTPINFLKKFSYDNVADLTFKAYSKLL